MGFPFAWKALFPGMEHYPHRNTFFVSPDFLQYVQGIYSSRYARTAVIGTRYVRKAVGAAGGAVGPVDTAIGIIRTYCSKCSAWIQ